MEFPSAPLPERSPSDVRIGNKTYCYVSLSADAKKLIEAIKDVERELARQQRIHTYLEISRRSMVQELLAHLPERSDS